MLWSEECEYREHSERWINDNVVSWIICIQPNEVKSWLWWWFLFCGLSVICFADQLIIGSLFIFFRICISRNSNGIFISAINQLYVQIFWFTISFISCLYMFRAPCAHHQEVKIALHSLWYHHTYRSDDTRGCVMQFWPPDDEHMVLETCRVMK